MDDHVLRDQIAAAGAYEHLHVPASFRQWSPLVCDAGRLGPGHRVLDVACGTGVLAREAASRVGPSGVVAGLDADPGMLAVAEQLAPRIEWKHGTAEALPYAADSFDAVVSQFGLMFFSDREQALREMLRVLAPEGTLVIAVWNGLEHAPAWRDEVALLDRFGGTTAGDALRAPFALGDTAQLTTLLERAAVSSIGIATHAGTVRFPSIRTMVEADLRGWLPVLGVMLDETQIARILSEAETLLAPYVSEDGQVVFPASAHIVTGQA
jgi:SAM-dependent methyltransferase